jgi:hypothetical protein
VLVHGLLSLALPQANMSVTSRIRLVREVAISIAVALANAVLFGLLVSVGEPPETYWFQAAGALVGLLLVASFLVVLALSLDASEGRQLALEPETTQPLQPQTSYQFPPA